MSLETRLGDLITAIGTDYKTFRTWLTGSATGTLASLTTTDKTSLIAAINELEARPSGGGDVTQGDLDDLKDEILGAGVPAALDTLDELAAALGDDANFATTVTTALGNRVRVDINNQGLTSPQQLNARTNIAAVGSADIGNYDADLVALYETAKT